LDLRYLNLDAFQLVVSSEPLSSLLSLLRSFNPDFLFHFSLTNNVNKAAEMVLEWLKVRPTAQFIKIVITMLKNQRSWPLPTDLIQLWEDYRFMAYCENIWDKDRGRKIQVTEEDRGHCHQILSQVSSSLTRILQAIAIITYPVYHPYYPPEAVIFRVYALLNFSWDELRMAFCSLRSLIGHEGDGFIRNIPIVALDMALSPASLLWDLTRGWLRLMWRILSGKVDKAFERVSICN
jgi:hypothetical protein